MLIPNWRKAWKMFSVRAMVVVGIIASLEPVMPSLSAYLPDKWVMYAMPVIIIARLIKQNNLDSDERIGQVYE